MSIESPADLAALRVIGAIVGQTLDAVLRAVRPGITTAELDAYAARLLAEAGARSAPRITYDFPGAVCISVNEEVAHGIPGPRKVRPGDVVNIDVSAEKGGYFADTGGTVLVRPFKPRLRKLIRAARQARSAGMRAARAGATVGSVGKAIEQAARRAGFGVIRNLGSHGVGRALHEEPEIPGYDEPLATRRLRKGEVITIEPFVTTRPGYVDEADDGWTLLNARGSRTAQFEHTIVVTNGAPLVLTAA